MSLLVLGGKKAYSDFRIQALLQKIKNKAEDVFVDSISSEFVYFLDMADPPDNKKERKKYQSKEDLDDIIEKAKELLDAEFKDKLKSQINNPDIQIKSADVRISNADVKAKELEFFVTPRKGTISPWSSKATDIFHNSGLSQVRRVERGVYFKISVSDLDLCELDIHHPKIKNILPFFYDRMTEGVYDNIDDIFAKPEPKPLVQIDIINQGLKALEDANTTMGLALSEEEISYLYEAYKTMGRNPSDVELLMFGQVNSEHCRHKIFNADWVIDGQKQLKSLFKMIQNTHEKNSKGTVVAYSDNSCVLDGVMDQYFEPQRSKDKVYSYKHKKIDIIAKVETHNHPTAISPFAGAATGVGGEIRDEGATGTGSKSKAGLNAFMVSNLRVPGFVMPWEKNYAEFPKRLASPFEIMMDGPIGGASFGNEFGRPQLCGMFKTYEENYNGLYRGYHKPIMLAGGMGCIKSENVHKKDIEPESYIIQIGGPAMKIGIGGGAASSMDTGTNSEDLDFNSVQRGNAEMQRRAQEVIDSCACLGKDNPILSIHDVGAGGLSNACPELVSETGGDFWLRKIHSEDRSMSPMEIWSCEAQERYVLAISPDRLDEFLEICKRERCPVAVIGQANNKGRLSLYDEYFDNKPINMDIGIILKKPPKMLRNVKTKNQEHKALDLSDIKLEEAIQRVLRLPSVSKKNFLITIADRSITGLVARDQMCGPWQEPVSDVALTASSYKSYTGEAMAIGERTSLALIDAPASCRMAIAEAITNIAGTNIGDIKKIKLSANWMCACGEDGEDASLYASVKTVGEELCPKLGISIPVGKDSLSMRTLWQDSKSQTQKMIAPLSLIASSFSPVNDVRKTVTPDIKNNEQILAKPQQQGSKLILLDLGQKKNRLGASALAQVYNQVGNEHPDLEDTSLFLKFFNVVQELVEKGLILAYHDRSDGGLITTVMEMAFAGRTGLKLCIDELGADSLDTNPLSILFSEELGAVVQVKQEDMEDFNFVLKKYLLNDIAFEIANIEHKSSEMIKKIEVEFKGKLIYSESLVNLNRAWSELSYRMQALRDNPICAKQEYDNLLDENDPGMNFKLTYDPYELKNDELKNDKLKNNIDKLNFVSSKPRVAILREQGINGQTEMAAVFDMAGFTSVDVHMTDLLGGEFDLKDFNGLVACGGFSYGDVLGAGSGWAKSILFNDYLKDMFTEFFNRSDSFSLGVCNGCQMLSQLKDIIPGAKHWPRFTKNVSEQFEARYVSVEVLPSPSIFLKGMEGSVISVPVAHGEGLADFSSTGSLRMLKRQKLIGIRYVDNFGKNTERYPYNPNGSVEGITGLTTKDGRVTIMMPHPERLFRSVQMSYRPNNLFLSDEGPWLKFFKNARAFLY